MFPKLETVDADSRRRTRAQNNDWKRRYREERTVAVEEECLLGRGEAMIAKLREVQKLQRSADALRERVRQLIEIMDEDHGKAIRVFTMVTVLFLPMYVVKKDRTERCSFASGIRYGWADHVIIRTFVSGFFGMNTVDIRDIEATQTLYWTIAIPVTVVVLAIAFVYGYKGDEIGDWIHDRIRPTNATWLPSRTEPAEPNKPLTSTIDGPQVRWAETDAGAKEVWKAVRNSVRRRKRKTDKDVKRTSTFHSDVMV